MMMPAGQTFRNDHLTVAGIIVALLITGFLLTGCSASYCRLKIDPELAARFAEGQPIPGYRYYSAGRARMPNAIIGVQDGYELTSKFWTPIDLHAGELEKLSRSMFPYRDNQLLGYYALAPDGTRVVVWYSSYGMGPTVKLGKGNTVQVFQPPPDSGGRFN